MRSASMKILAAISIAIIGLAGAGGAATDPPQSFKARDALARRDTIAKKLRLEYYSKLMDADAQLARDLDIALRVAASGGADAEEIQRITSARSKAQADLRRDTQEAHGFVVFLIKADGGWQDTVELHRGDMVVIGASGKWTFNVHDSRSQCGPDGVGGGSPAQGSLIGILRGQKDDGAIEIGSSRQFSVPADGMLELGMRGHAPIGSGLNDGAMEVQIKVTSQRH